MAMDHPGTALATDINTAMAEGMATDPATTGAAPGMVTGPIAPIAAGG
jgi:hypothetical protein